MRIQHIAFLLAASAASLISTVQVGKAADRNGFPEAVKTAKGENRMICKTQPKIGSRFGTRTCHSKAEWDAMREAALQAAADMQTRTIDISRPRDGDENVTLGPQ